MTAEQKCRANFEFPALEKCSFRNVGTLVARLDVQFRFYGQLCHLCFGVFGD